MAMSAALREARNSSSIMAAWTLIALSFIYGVLHAAGPGHGKTVVSAWLLATENELKRGIIIAFMSSMIQAATAVVLVGGALLLVAGAASTARQVAGLMENASYGMIAALGLYLVWTAFQKVLRRQGSRVALAVSGAGEAAASVPDFSTFQPMANGHVHMTAAEHANCEECGHAHAPSPAEVRNNWSWQRALAMSFAIGIRPCTGAIVILLLAYTIGMFSAGIAATFAMGFGTFLTVAAIAAISVYARKYALMLAARNNRTAFALGLTLRFAGGIVIAAFGALMLAASLTGTTGSI